MRIFFFGDSITQGFYDPAGGWAQKLVNELHQFSFEEMVPGKSTFIKAFNLGVSANMTQDVTDRLESEVAARTHQPEDAVIVLQVGINDAYMEDNRALRDVYEFQEILEKLIDKALGITAKVLLVGLVAVDESQTNPWPYVNNLKPQWTNARLNTFEDTIKQSAQRKDVAFVAVHDRFLAELERGRDLLADGLHPNHEGHTLIASLVSPALNQLIA